MYLVACTNNGSDAHQPATAQTDRRTAGWTDSRLPPST